MAQVPHIMTYQGRVASGGTNFSGTGQFKFALVSGGTSAAAQANASVTVFFGFVVQIAVTSGGAGYTAPPAVTITDSAGSGAFAIAQIANGQVTGITVTDAGSGYSASPSITIAPPTVNLSYTTYWSHDGTSSAGGEPASVVPVSVSQGLFTVGLGDTMIPNMSALPPHVLANPDVRLRMWFNDGVNGFSQLSPDQRLTSAAYAMMADTVRDGAITSAKLSPGAVGASQLADGAITAAKLATNSNIATPSGSIVLSQEANATNLLAAGYVKMPGAKIVMEEWEILPASNPIASRNGPAILSAGSDIILWGGINDGGTNLNTGGRLSTVSNAWFATSINNAPSARETPAAVWTGDTMIIWGGFARRPSYADINTGGIYTPATDSWSPVTTESAPSPRNGHAAVWTGSEMIVWGGYQQPSATYLNTGGRYHPASNRWSVISTVNAPSPRVRPFATWTGSEMIVWGGNGINQTTDRNTGARYNPATDTWTSINSNNSLYLSDEHLAVWTGTEMVVWNENELAGARYDPATDTWRRMNSSGPRSPQFATLAGENIFYLCNSESSSGTYNLVADNWSFFSLGNGLYVDGQDFASWTGKSLVVLSPYDLQRVAKYTPSRPLFLYQRP